MAHKDAMQSSANHNDMEIYKDSIRTNTTSNAMDIISVTSKLGNQLRIPHCHYLIKMHMETTNYSANTYHVIMRNGKQQYKSGRLVSKSTHHHQRERDYHQNS